MRLSPAGRKLTLTTHVVTSVGWLGAVACFLALSLVGLLSDDLATVRGAYLVMEAAGWYVLLPLSVASLATGLIQGFGTRWGVVRHYWVVMKLIINVIATLVLVLYMQSLAYLADQAASPAADLESLRSPSPVVHALGAMMLLIAATVLSVYKPKGETRWGHRFPAAAA